MLPHSNSFRVKKRSAAATKPMSSSAHTPRTKTAEQHIQQKIDSMSTKEKEDLALQFLLYGQKQKSRTSLDGSSHSLNGSFSRRSSNNSLPALSSLDAGSGHSMSSTSKQILLSPSTPNKLKHKRPSLNKLFRKADNQDSSSSNASFGSGFFARHAKLEDLTVDH